MYLKTHTNILAQDTDQEYRILKIKRQQNPFNTLDIYSDSVKYSLSDKTQLLITLQAANQSSFKSLGTFNALLGFIKFQLGHYMLLVSNVTTSGKIGESTVFQIDDFTTIPLFNDALDTNHNESKYTF